MKKRLRIRKKVLWSWVISYLTIMVIPLIFGVGIYLYALHTTRIAVRTIHEHSILQVRDTFDGTLNDLRKVSYTMASSADKGGLSYREFSQNSDYPLNAAPLQKTISSYRIANDAIEEIYIYFPNNDYILSSISTYKYESIAAQSKRFLGLEREEFD